MFFFLSSKFKHCSLFKQQFALESFLQSIETAMLSIEQSVETAMLSIEQSTVYTDVG